MYWWISFATGYAIVYGIDYVIGYAIGHTIEKVKMLSSVFSKQMIFRPIIPPTLECEFLSIWLNQNN